jgi:hypothetical protein
MQTTCYKTVTTIRSVCIQPVAQKRELRGYMPTPHVFLYSRCHFSYKTVEKLLNSKFVM